MEIILRRQAIKRGLKRYFTGKPCKRGHIAERRIMGVCVECALEDSRAHRLLHAKRLNKDQRDRTARDPEKSRKYMREYMQRYRETEKGKEAVRRAGRKYEDSLREARIHKRALKEANTPAP